MVSIIHQPFINRSVWCYIHVPSNACQQDIYDVDGSCCDLAMLCRYLRSVEPLVSEEEYASAKSVKENLQ